MNSGYAGLVDLAAYLARIGHRGPMDLPALHTAHLLAVPFENLDIHLGRPIVLDAEAFYRKIVANRRGGFCYEQNGLFAEVLRAAGFRVDLLSAGVAHLDGGFGPDYDHLVLLVEGRWLADVGFGEGFREPLHLEAGEQTSGGALYRLDRANGLLTLLRRDPGQDWKPQYRLTLQPRRLDEFAGMCRYHQTARWSSFTQCRVCSRATPEGRITLSGMRLIETAGPHRTERPVASEADFQALLRERFGIVLRPEC